MSMRSHPRSVAAFLFAALCAGGCASPEPDAEARLLDRRDTDSWVETDASTPEGKRLLREELGGARGAVVATLPRFEERPASFLQDPPPRRAASRPSEPPLPAWPGPKVSVVFTDAPLKDIVAAVAAEMGVNTILPDDLTARASVNFPSIDPLAGLDLLLRRHGKRVQFEHGVLSVVDYVRPRSTQTFKIRSNRPFDAEKLVKPLLNPDGAVVYDEVQRQFVVTDDVDALERVVAFMQTADSRQPQVLIEALIVEVRRSRDRSHGAAVDAGQVEIGDYTGVARSLLAAPASTSGTAPFTFGVVNADEMMQVLLTARSGKAKFNVLSNPLVSAISGTKAEIKVVERIPYVQSTNTINVDGGNAATNSTEQIAFEEIGITLSVTPDVGADRVVKMEITPDVRELVDFALGVPVIDTRKVTSHVMVRNNETLVIGGLLRSAKRRREDKVPVLGDIPLLGDLFFKRETEDQERVELLVFVTPHLTGFGAEEVEAYRAQRDLLGPGGRAPLVDDELKRHPGTPTGR
jgi:type IV pilus assembly protein PilQ